MSELFSFIGAVLLTFSFIFLLFARIIASQAEAPYWITVHVLWICFIGGLRDWSVRLSEAWNR